MPSIKTFIKDPDAQLPYGIDWEDWLVDGDTISSSYWIVPAPLSLLSDSYDNTTTAAWISGGVVGGTYTATNRIETTYGHIDDRSLDFVIEER